MLGAVAALPACSAALLPSHAACREPGETTGRLVAPGWPAAASLERLRVRAVGLVAGNRTSSGPSPCQRLDDRILGLEGQCDTSANLLAGARLDLLPAAAPKEPIQRSVSSAVIFGETALDPVMGDPDPSLWIPVLVLPETHPLALGLRRDVAPAGVQPDGLLGTALFDDTEVVLDYTDPNPGLRISCLAAETGRCLAAPSCTHDGRSSCCFGLPLPLLLAMAESGTDACCSALPPAVLHDIQPGSCSGFDPL
jgi:hypothetical protein